MADEFTKAALYGIKAFNKKVKEKIGIQKLIELLNEYEKKVRKSEYYEWEKGIGGDFNLFRRDTRDEEGSHLYSDTADTYVTSKKYGFIGWLVENEKIDYKKLLENSDFIEIRAIRWGIAYSLIMLLSIQDEPIEYLISILK